MTSDSSPDLDEAARYFVSDPERALAASQRFLDAHPDHPDGLFSRFQALDELGEYEMALADINRALELKPDWVGHFARGIFFHNHGHYGRAIADLTKAKALDTEDFGTSEISCYRADSFARLGRLDEALEDCALLQDDHWTPGHNGLPPGDKEQFIREIKRRAAAAKSGWRSP